MTTIDLNQATALVRSSGMTGEETRSVLDLLLSGTPSPEAGGALLRTWAERGETAEELAAVVEALRGRSVRVPVDQPCLEVVGTGGSGRTRFNVSTASAFILAAAGIPVAKHGNRGSRCPNGSFDFLEALGIPFPLSAQALARLQRETGVCFLFARAHHPAMAAVVPYRKAANRRVIFNLAGPLANPAEVSHQVVGVCDEMLQGLVAEVLGRLGRLHALVVRGHPGIDEISVTGPSTCLVLSPSGVEQRAMGEPLHPDAVLPGGDGVENAAIFLRMLSGEERGPLLDMVLLNAGVALDLWKGRPFVYAGVGMAEAAEILASGAARFTFETHRSLARELAGQGLAGG